MDIFSNREIATIIWILVAIVLLSRNPEFVKGLKSILVTLWNKYIIISLILISIYIAGMVYILYKVGLWEFHNLKNTIYWAVSVALVSVFRSQKAINDEYYFSTAVKDNVKIIIIFEFILTFYSFNIWIEILVFPILLLFVLMQAYSEYKKEYEAVRKLSEFILLAYVVILFIYSIYEISSNFVEFATIDTLKEFILPIVMSLLFLPFMYLTVMYLSYERAFFMLKLSLNDNLMPYAKRWSMINFHGDRILLSRWASIVGRFDIKTKEQLRESINKVKKMRLAEEACESVNVKDGWSPHEARYYLDKFDIKTKFYDPLYDDLWFASSEPLCLDGDIAVLANNIQYFIEGSEKHAKSLKITLDVNEPEKSNIAHHEFLELCGTLTQNALGMELPKQIRHPL